MMSEILITTSNQVLQKSKSNVESTTDGSPIPSFARRDMISMSQSSQAKQHQCDICGTLFAKPSKLLSHKKSVHENARPYECKQCGDTFKRKDHLSRHEASRHADNRHVIPCPTFEQTGCLMSFPNKDQVRKHVFRTHEKRLRCDECQTANKEPLVFQKKSQLRKHMIEAHGVQRFACEGHCNRKFEKKKYLAAHMARVKERDQLCARKLYLFDEDSCELEEVV